jgi:hypothetical protein
MKTTQTRVSPEEYILSPEERLEAALAVARQAFRKTNLTVKDVNDAVKSIRRKAYAKKEADSR